MKRKTSKSPVVPPPLEKKVQQQITRLFEAAGGVVRTTSQTRASRVSPGIPDLMVHLPRVFVWFEVKTYARPWRPAEHPSTWRVNPLSTEQEAFRTDCGQSNVRHAWGGLWQAEELLISLDLASRRADGQLMIQRNTLTTPLARR